MAADTLSREGARLLADQVRNYWWSKGQLRVEVEIKCEDYQKEVRGVVWVVRSNLVNGLPPK